MSKTDIKNKIQDTFGDLCADVFVELQKTKDKDLTETMSKLINCAPNKETGLHIFLECVEQYVQSIVTKDPITSNLDFESGMLIVMNQKYDEVSKKFNKSIKELTITFRLKQDGKVYSKFILKNSFKALDMCYLVMSNMHIGDFFHIYCRLPAREYRDANSITRLPEYEFEFNKNERISDLDIESGDTFSLLLKDDKGIVKFEIIANIENITEDKHPDSPFVHLDHGYGGPELPNDQKEKWKTLHLDDEYITAMFLNEKMYYERPDLYGQLDDDLSNIMELGLIMYEDEESENEDLDDTNNINPSLMN